MGTPAQLPPHIEVSPSSSSSTSAIAPNAPPPMPPPPYFKTYSINPSSFKAGINDKLNDPLVSLFRLVVPMLQIIFALAAGISYAIELSHGNGRGGASASFVFSQVVFGSTLVALTVNAISVRYYRISWLVDWILSVFWFALFATFYQVYLGGELEPAFAWVNLGRMERAVWCNLTNALLWLASALFSSAMCCSGIKASVKGKFRNRRQKKGEKKLMQEMCDMESGVF
jgi:hypothetical protein